MTTLTGAMAEMMKDVKEVTITPRKDHEHTMHAVEWQGRHHVEVNEHRPKPLVTDPKDALVRVTSTAICGSDLHIYVGAMPGMKAGQVLGHEFMGIVEDVGPEVKHIKKGDKVVASFDIACGHCFYCDKQLYTSCDETNNSQLSEATYGHRSGGFYGYTELTGGYDGGQADYTRVPFADLNLLKIPHRLQDKDVLFLSDILPTAWHGNELAKVGEGDTVAIWGCGPVGILGAQCAYVRGAKKVIMIDSLDYRLNFAKENVGKGRWFQTINFARENVRERLKELVGLNGVDCGIEMVGFHYSATWTHAIEKAIGLETDPADIINEIIMSVRKGGRIGVIGVYAAYCNHFHIGGFMEKGLTMAGGQTPVQKYWHMLLRKIEKGELDPAMVITHDLPLEKAVEGYEMFNNKKEGCIKVVMHPQHPTAK